MHLFLKHRLLWLPGIQFAVMLLFCTLLTASAVSAEKNTAAPLCPEITVALAPVLRTIIFNSVAVLPFQDDNPQLAADLSDSFYTALAQTGKYNLLPASSVTNWLEQNSKKLKKMDLQQQVVRLGRAVKARGVIQATLVTRRDVPLTNKGSISSLAFNIRMTDTRTEKTAWTLSVVCENKKQSRELNKQQIRKIMEKSLQNLISEMVANGDIFSTQLPKPTIISSRGGLRKVRVVLHPDPASTFAAYQLLTAEDPDDTFTARTPPVSNDHAPMILEDTDLKDGKSYSYTVIGLTDTGLANVPAPPFVVTTSGAPKPLDSLQASGNNLRHIPLFWTPSQDPNVNGYTIYRSTSPSGPFEKIATINDRRQQSYIDYGTGWSNSYGNLADDSIYYYTLHTKNKLDVESKNTPVVSARTKGAPLPPTKIRAIEKQPKKISLFWTSGEDPDIKGYAIFRNTSEQGEFQQIDFVHGLSTQEYTDTGSWNTPLGNNTTYYYRLRSVNVLDLSSKNSTTVSATTKPTPVAVHGLRVTNNQFRQVNLQWQPNPEHDIATYEIFRGETEDDLRRIATVKTPTTSFTDSGLLDSSIYWYQVRAIDSDQLQGALISPVTATTKPRPAAPSGLTAQLTAQGITLQWQDNPEKDIDHFEIYIMGFLTTKIGETLATTFLYSDKLDPDREYRFQVRAVNSDGLTGGYSQPVLIRIPVPEATGED